MISKITMIAAAATLVSFSAFAQTSSDDSPSQTTNATDQALQMDQPTADVFYSDVNARTLRPEAEWATNWSGLNDEQRAKLRADCAGNTNTVRSEGDTRVCAWAGNN